MPGAHTDTPSASNLTSAGSLLQLIRGGRARTRADLVELTGLARSTVGQRIEALIGLGLVDVVGDSASTGGRPPKALAFKLDSGVVCAADLGVTHSQLAVCDLGGTILAESRAEPDIRLGPEPGLGWMETQFGAPPGGAGGGAGAPPP